MGEEERRGRMGRTIDTKESLALLSADDEIIPLGIHGAPPKLLRAQCVTVDTAFAAATFVELVRTVSAQIRPGVVAACNIR